MTDTTISNDMRVSHDMRVIEEQIADLLNCKNPNEVADMLLRAGHLGRRMSTNACPVANYIRWATGWRHIGVAPTRVFIHFGPLPSGGTMSIDLPLSVNLFITKFDARAYPKLEADPEPEVIHAAKALQQKVSV